jgi:hypothetical protein
LAEACADVFICPLPIAGHAEFDPRRQAAVPNDRIGVTVPIEKSRATAH